MISQWATVAFALLWGACGMKTGLLALAPDASGSGAPSGGESGAGGMAVGGNGGQTSTGPAVGGSTTVHVGGSGGNGFGGSATVARGGSGGSGFGGSTVARGGSGGNASGGNSLGGSSGRGGDGGSANRGGSGGSGGRPGTGGAIVSSPDAAPLRPDAREVALPVGTPVIDPSRNSLTINAGTVILSGTVSSACSGTGSICGGLSYPENSFCSSGTVGASPTYSSWANAGFTVNQASGTSGSTKSLPFVGTSITVSYSNKGGSTLELQLWDGSNYWCADLPPSAGPNTVTIPFSKLNTACWDMSGSAFVSGTPVDMVQFLIPCSATTPTPFDYCFLGLTVQ
jgi:hypothetical protein